MAWHYNLLNIRDLDQELENHKDAIIKKFNNNYANLAWSLKYEKLKNTLSASDYRDYKIDPNNPNEDIYLTYRKYQWAYTCFEVHVDTNTNELIEIFLVQ